MTRQIMQPEENPESLSVWWEGSYLSITDKESGACIQISGETAVEMARAILKQDKYECLSQYQHVSLPLDEDHYPNANARLIAAAPALLEALRRIAAATPQNTNSQSLDQLRSWVAAVANTALAQVTGGEDVCR